MEIRDLLARNVLLIVDPYTLGKDADAFMSEFGGYMGQIAAVAKDEEGFALYDSKYAPLHEKHGNFFSTIAEAAGAVGITLYAVINTFIDNYYAVDPSYKTYNSEGVAADGFICPNRSAFWSYLANIADELSAYPIKGIILQGLSYIRENYCFCNTCKNEFAKVAGLNFVASFESLRDNPEVLSKWFEWRAEKIKSVVTRIHEAVKEKGIEVLPMVNLDPGVGYQNGAYTHFGQKIEALAEVTGHVLINLNAWSPVLPKVDTPEFNALIQKLLPLRNITARRRKLSFMYWSFTEEDEFESLKKIASFFNATKIVAYPKFPRAYKRWRELHLNI